MMNAFRVVADALDPVELVLACDPAVESASSAEALSLYRMHGDPSGLVVTEEATRFRCRPLTAVELDAAKQRAGRPSVLGQHLRRELAHQDFDEECERLEAATTAVRDRFLALQLEVEDADPELLKRVTDELKALNAELARALRARPAWVDALNEVEHAAFQAHASWVRLYHLELVRASLVSVSSWEDVADLDSKLARMAHPSMAEMLLTELGTHVLAISRLGAEKKALYGRWSGSPDQRSESTGGSATTATATGISSENEGTAGSAQSAP